MALILAANDLDVEKKRRLAEQFLEEMKKNLPDFRKIAVLESEILIRNIPGLQMHMRSARVALNYQILKGGTDGDPV